MWLVNRRSCTLAAVLISGLLAVAGCSAPASYAEVLADRGGSVAGAHDPWPDSVLSAMPAVGYRDPSGGSDQVGVSEAVVVGTFTGWEAAEPRIWPRAQSTTYDIYSQAIVLTLAVDEVIAVDDGTQIAATERLYLAPPSSQRSPEEVAEELVALDRLVLFLSPLEHTDRTDGWFVALDWSLVGEVADDGTVTWPVLQAAQAKEQRRDEEWEEENGDETWMPSTALTLGTLPIDALTLDDLREAADGN